MSYRALIMSEGKELAHCCEKKHRTEWQAENCRKLGQAADLIKGFNAKIVVVKLP